MPPSQPTRTILAAVALALLGAGILVLFRGYVTDELFWPYLLVVLGVALGVGMAGDLRRWKRLAVVAGGLASLGAGLGGYTVVAWLEGQAMDLEFNPADLDRPDFFIALEAYALSESKRPVPRPFTAMTRRLDYDDATWTQATAVWQARTESEREAIRRKWRDDYAHLHRLAVEGILFAILAPWNWVVFAVGTSLSAGIVSQLEPD
jgi:hypothetical protein